MSLSDAYIDKLTQLRLCCMEIANDLTAVDKNEYENYSNRSVLAGHSAPVAYTVYKLLGGWIVVGKSPDGSLHYWNRTPDGDDVDLCSDVFGGDGINGFLDGRLTHWTLVDPKIESFAEKISKIFY